MVGTSGAYRQTFGIWPFKKEVRTHWSQSLFEFIGIRYTDGEWHHCWDRIKKWATRYGQPPREGDPMESGVCPAFPKLKSLNAVELRSLVGVLVWDRRLRVTSTKALRQVFPIMNRALAGSLPSTSEMECI